MLKSHLGTISVVCTAPDGSPRRVCIRLSQWRSDGPLHARLPNGRIMRVFPPFLGMVQIGHIPFDTYYVIEAQSVTLACAMPQRKYRSYVLISAHSARAVCTAFFFPFFRALGRAPEFAQRDRLSCLIGP